MTTTWRSSSPIALGVIGGLVVSATGMSMLGRPLLPGLPPGSGYHVLAAALVGYGGLALFVVSVLRLESREYEAVWPKVAHVIGGRVESRRWSAGTLVGVHRGRGVSALVVTGTADGSSGPLYVLAMEVASTGQRWTLRRPAARLGDSYGAWLVECESEKHRDLLVEQGLTDRMAQWDRRPDHYPAEGGPPIVAMLPGKRRPVIEYRVAVARPGVGSLEPAHLHGQLELLHDLVEIHQRVARMLSPDDTST